MVGTPPRAGRRAVRPRQDPCRGRRPARLGVSAQTASRWHARWRAGGVAGMRTARHGKPPRLGPAELARIRRVLDRGPVAAGFDNDLWTLARIAEVIERTTGVAHHPGHVWRILKAMRWEPAAPSPQGRRARRDRHSPVGRPGVAADQANCECVGMRSGRIAVRLRRRHRGMTPKQTGTEVAFGRAVCRGVGVDLAHRLLA